MGKTKIPSVLNELVHPCIVFFVLFTYKWSTWSQFLELVTKAVTKTLLFPFCLYYISLYLSPQQTSFSQRCCSRHEKYPINIKAIQNDNKGEPFTSLTNTILKRFFPAAIWYNHWLLLQKAFKNELIVVCGYPWVLYIAWRMMAEWNMFLILKL